MNQLEKDAHSRGSSEESIEAIKYLEGALDNIGRLKKANLTFASEEEAMHHLANLTGKRIKVAKNRFAPTQGSYDAETSITVDDDREEIDVSFEFDFTPGSSRSWESPGEDAMVEVNKITDVETGEELDDKYDTESIRKQLQEAAFSEIDRQFDYNESAYEDHLDGVREERMLQEQGH